MTINDDVGGIFFDTNLGRQLSWMYSGIESVMKKESAHACALLLSTYTEVLGGFVTGDLKNPKMMRRNYESFLPYLGQHYVLLHKKYDLYGIVRNKLVHEFSPRPSYIIWVRDSPQKDLFGVEIVDGNLNFNLQEYYRDFRNGIMKYRNEFNTNGMHIINVSKVLQIDWTNVSHKPKKNSTNDLSNQC